MDWCPMTVAPPPQVRLNYNKIGDKGAAELAKALTTNISGTLKKVSCSQRAMMAQSLNRCAWDRGARRVVADGLSFHRADLS